MSATFSCDQCDKVYALKSSLWRHKKKHVTETSYTCTQCPNVYKNNSSLQRHIKDAHSGQESFECDQCENSYKSQGALNRHISKAHSNTKKEYKCTEEGCDNVYQHLESLKRHQKYDHSDEKLTYNCSECDKTYTSKIGLNEHIKTKHSDNVPEYKCDQCDRICNSKSNFTRHQKTHSENRKKYVCKVCAHESTNTTDVKRHVRLMHTKLDEPVSCSRCEEEFDTKYDFTVHWNEDHKNKAHIYNCEYCDYSSKWNENVQRHIESEHDEYGNKECECCLKNAYTLRDYEDPNEKKTIKICRKCYQKVTGFSCRAEKDMVRHLKSIEKIKPYIALKDKIIANDMCNTKRRPDVLISSGDLHIIVECDEKQHQYRIPSCEAGRMDEIIDELKTGKIVFVRWNPDKYNSNDEKMKLRKERLKMLSDKIIELTENQPDEPISVIYMFYDEDNEVIADRWKKEFIR